MVAYAEDAELIDVFDETGAHVGVAPRQQAHDEGLWHKASHLWVFWRAADGRQKALFQRRSASKRFFPGKLDVAAAGHYTAGESTWDGVRELEEELGIPAERYDIRLVGTHRFEHCDDRIKNREFWNVFICQMLVDPREAEIDPDEVDDLIVVDVADMLALLREEVATTHAESVVTGETLNIALADFIGDYRAYFIAILGEAI